MSGTIPFKELVHSRILYAAIKEIGQKEIFGHKDHNPRIIEYLKTCREDFTADEIPWCSAFVNWCILNAGLVESIRGTGDALARSWLQWGIDTREPIPGAIVVLQNKERESMHVGLFVARTNKGILVLGGNQANEVNITPFQVHQLASYRVTRDYPHVVK